MITMKFDQKISRLCEERGWNRSELARRCGVSRTTAGYWWDGVRKPFDDALIALSDTFGVGVDFLVSDDQDEPPAPALSEDERAILLVIRGMGLDARTAIARLTAQPPASRSLGPVRLIGSADLTSLDDHLERQRQLPREATVDPAKKKP